MTPPPESSTISRCLDQVLLKVYSQVTAVEAWSGCDGFGRPSMAPRKQQRCWILSNMHVAPHRCVKSKADPKKVTMVYCVPLCQRILATLEMRLLIALRVVQIPPYSIKRTAILEICTHERPDSATILQNLTGDMSGTKG